MTRMSGIAERLRAVAATRNRGLLVLSRKGRRPHGNLHRVESVFRPTSPNFAQRGGAGVASGRKVNPLSSVPRRFEISQIRWRLILLGGHQNPIPAQKIVF